MTRKGYIVSTIICGALVAVPFLAVEIPPITDLPQLTAQVRLLFEALGGSGDYRVQWLTPNKLGYVPLLLAWPVGDPIAAARLGLFGLIIAMIVNFFLASAALDFAISALGVLIFAGLTAWDTQRIKNEYAEHYGEEMLTKMAILGALGLYMNFVNLFLMLLQFFGNRE